MLARLLQGQCLPCLAAQLGHPAPVHTSLPLSACIPGCSALPAATHTAAEPVVDGGLPAVAATAVHAPPAHPVALFGQGDLHAGVRPLVACRGRLD